MQWVWASHPRFSKWQGNICSKVLTSAGTELGMGGNCFGSKDGKTGGGGGWFRFWSVLRWKKKGLF
jgi:hypothetical protein